MAKFSCKCGRVIDFDNYEDFDQPFINCPKCGRLLLFN